MFIYKLYGLVIDSDMLLPELVPNGKAEVDIYVHRASFPEICFTPLDWFMRWHLPEGELWLSCAKLESGYFLRFSELADFLINNSGKQIVYLPKPEIPQETIHHLLLDQVIPLVINLRGSEAFHVSAVLVPQGVIAFAGPAGFGKSTLAGSFVNVGFPLLSDDCLALYEEKGSVHSIPAYPGLRLWRDATEHLFGNNIGHKSVAHYTNKLRVGIETQPEASCSEAQPLKRLYDIAEQGNSYEKNEIAIERLSPQESFMALVRCTFRLDITDRNMLKRQFQFLKQVASTVPVRRLIFPRDFNFLPAVREAILKDLQDLDN